VPHRKRLLVVDDERPILNSVRRALGGAHDVVGFERGMQALEVLEAGARFDLVFCDLMMPEMSGMSFCSAVERLDPKQASRIVLLTGGAFTPQSRELLESGRFRSLDKPVDIKSLRALVESTLPLA
jgi:CheY-like chemotaxis protein